jgi:vacuolar-type H+-ATPase subunit I/STV1
VLGYNRGLVKPLFNYINNLRRFKMEGYIKKLTKDILYCLKLSIYFFAAPFILGGVIGLIQHGFNLKEILVWSTRLTLLFSAVGMGVAALSFIRPDSMRPLNYQSEWEEYFGVLNLTVVILIISLAVAVYGFILDNIVTVYM